MKNAGDDNGENGNGMRSCYDFSGGVRGKYAGRFKEGVNLVLIEPGVRDVFPDSESVNEALRALAAIVRSRNAATR